MATATDRLKRLEERQAKIQAQIQAVRNRQAEQDRKLDTRRKVLLGAYVLEAMRAQNMGAAGLQIGNGPGFAAWLTRPQDRELFDLATPPQPPAGGAQ